MNQQPSKLIEQQIEEFTSRLRKDPKKGWEYLIKNGDPYSVRQWFMKKFVATGYVRIHR